MSPVAFFNVKNGCKCLILRSRSRINSWNSHPMPRPLDQVRDMLPNELCYLLARTPLMEIRAIHPREKKKYPTLVGFFEAADLHGLVDIIADLCGKEYQVYHTLNVIDPSKRQATHGMALGGNATGDADILRRVC